MSLSPSISLTQRLVDRYVMFGVTCVFLCVTLVVLLAWVGWHVEWQAAGVILPLGLLLGGGLVLRRTVGLSAEIDRQLRQLDTAGFDPANLQRIPSAEPMAAGWNAVVAELQDRTIMASLDAKLSSACGDVEQNRWASIFNTLSDGLAVCDEHDVVLSANNALAAHLNAAAADELVGKPLSELLQRVARTSAVLAATASHSSGLSGLREIFLGSMVAEGVLRVMKTPIIGDAFGKGTTLWIVKDVTQQKLAEQMRMQFVATATHELRTPLTNIRAYSELLSDEDDLNLERQKEFCNIIGSEVSRLARFVDQMLNVSQMEAGGLTISRHETDLERLLTEVTDAVSPQATQKGLAFKAVVPAKLPKARLDKDKLAAALVNLLGNAVKYTPAGNVALTIEVTADQLAFHIDDCGIGIAPAELERLGTRFFRSADERVRAINGSGLGLAFAQEVARLHGGRLTATSELNKGSRFTLSIPLR